MPFRTFRYQSSFFSFSRCQYCCSYCCKPVLNWWFLDYSVAVVVFTRTRCISHLFFLVDCLVFGQLTLRTVIQISIWPRHNSLYPICNKRFKSTGASLCMCSCPFFFHFYVCLWHTIQYCHLASAFWPNLEKTNGVQKHSLCTIRLTFCTFYCTGDTQASLCAYYFWRLLNHNLGSPFIIFFLCAFPIYLFFRFVYFVVVVLSIFLFCNFLRQFS